MTRLPREARLDEVLLELAVPNKLTAYSTAIKDVPGMDKLIRLINSENGRVYLEQQDSLWTYQDGLLSYINIADLNSEACYALANGDLLNSNANYIDSCSVTKMVTTIVDKTELLREYYLESGTIVSVREIAFTACGYTIKVELEYDNDSFTQARYTIV